MSAEIIERGRGPEIKGTRITVYSIIDYFDEGIVDSSQIAAELRLTAEEVDAAIAYIREHKAEVSAEYERIINRPCVNPPWVEAGMAQSWEELKQRLRARRSGEVGDAHRR
jgi:uncharacterized protein (DUF433 family)